MSDRVEVTAKPTTKLERRTQKVVDFFQTMLGNAPDVWGRIRGESVVRGDKSRVGTPMARMTEIMKKVEEGKPVTENDFGRMALFTYFTQDAIHNFLTVSRDRRLERPEAEVPLGKDKKSWFERVGIVAVDIIPALGGLLGRKVKPETTAEKQARWKQGKKPEEQYNVPTFLKSEVKRVHDQFDKTETERDSASLTKRLAGKNFVEKLILAKHAERYGVVGETGTFSKDAVKKNITYLAKIQVEKEAMERGETLSESALQESTRAYLDRPGQEGIKFIDQELKRAKEVYNTWIKLNENEHFVLQGFRTLCQMFNLNPDSVIAPDGVLREFNPQNPFEPGKEIKFVTVKKADGVAELPVDKTSIFDFLDNEIGKMRFRILEAHIKTLITKAGPKGEGSYVTYHEGNKIRLHSWSASEAANEIAAAGYGDRLLNVNNEIDQRKLDDLVNDTIAFGDSQDRQRIHNLVAFSTLFQAADRHYGIWRKFTERAADTNWDEWGSKTQLQSYVDPKMDPDFALAVKKYTTGEFFLIGPPSPDSFDGQKLKAQQEGNIRRIDDLNLAETRALQLMKLFLAPYKGWTKSDPSAYQLYNYIFAPGSQDVEKQEINAAVASGFAQALQSGETIWLEGTNAVTGQQELIFKSAKNAPGFFVMSLDYENDSATPTVRFVDEQHSVLEIQVDIDGTTGKPVYKKLEDISQGEIKDFLYYKTNYRKPGWMMPLEEAAGPMWTQAFNMGDVMGGVLATDWDVENIQRRIVHLGRGEMYDPKNPSHWAEIVKYFYKLRTNLGGTVDSRSWGLEFSDEKDFRGQELNPLDSDHLAFIASKVKGLTVEQWQQNWRANHVNREFTGGRDENGSATKDSVEVLQHLMEPRNWKIEGCENGLYVDLTKPIWQDRLQSMQFLFWRFEQARKTFSTILPALRGLAPSEITIGGARYENGVYHGMTPAKAHEMLKGVFGNLAWWEAHSAAQVWIQRIHEQMDRDLRKEIAEEHIDHDGILAAHDREMLWNDTMGARLSHAEEIEAQRERHFFRGREIYLTRRENDWVLKAEQIKGSSLTAQEKTEVLAVHHTIFGEDIVLTNNEQGQKMTPLGKARMIKAERRFHELLWEADKVQLDILSSTPGTSISTIWGAIRQKKLCADVVPDYDKYQLERIGKNPRLVLELQPKGFIKRGHPRYRYIRDKILGGLYDSYSRYVSTMTKLDGNLQRKIIWGALTGSQASVNQGLWFNLIDEAHGFNNALELKLQFQMIEAELSGAYGDRGGEGIWRQEKGEHSWVRDGQRRFAQLFFDLDITDTAEVDIAGGDELRSRLTREFFNDPRRLLKTVYQTDIGNAEEADTASFEQWWRSVLDPFAKPNRDDPGADKYREPPSWWVDYPAVTISRRDLIKKGEGKWEEETRQETVQIVWDVASAASNYAQGHNMSTDGVVSTIANRSSFIDPTLSLADNAARLNITVEALQERIRSGEKLGVKLDGINIDEYISNYGVTPAEVIKRISSGKFRKVTIGEITYVGIRQTAAEIAAANPVFNETISVIELDDKTHKLINNTLVWLNSNVLQRDENDLPQEISSRTIKPEVLTDLLMDYAYKNFPVYYNSVTKQPEGPLMELEEAYKAEYKQKEKPKLTRALTLGLKRQLDPVHNPEGLRFFIFSLFGLDIAEAKADTKTRFLTDDGHFNIGAIQDAIPEVGRRLRPPGLILQCIGIAQARNGDFEKRRIFRLRKREGGLGDKGKQAITLEWARLYKQEVDEISRESPKIKADPYRYRKDIINSEIIPKMLELGIDMKNDTPERKALYSQWLGPDWENPVGYKELEQMVRNPDWEEFKEIEKYKTWYGKPAPWISGIFGWFKKQSEQEKGGADDFILRWIDCNRVGVLGVLGTQAIIAPIGYAQTLSAFGGGNIGSGILTFLGSWLLPSLATYIPWGVGSNGLAYGLYRLRKWKPYEWFATRGYDDITE